MRAHQIAKRIFSILMFPLARSRDCPWIRLREHVQRTTLAEYDGGLTQPQLSPKVKFEVENFTANPCVLLHYQNTFFRF